MATQSLCGRWQFRQAGTDGWLPGEVPGGVHTDLMALGMLPDPFVSDNEIGAQWVAETDWEYRVVFDVSPELLADERVFLVSDGLDTLADVFLNGAQIGASDNMFHSHRWDVTAALEGGANELRIEFRSPVAYVRPRQESLPLPSPTPCIQGGPYLRKAPSQFGWDWGPKLAPIGVWKDIRLESYSAARFGDVHIRQAHLGDLVVVSADVVVEQWRDGDLALAVSATAPDGTALHSTRCAVAGSSSTASTTIPNPQLWWPNGLGDQPLYTVRVTLSEGGVVRDMREYSLGLRTVELRQEPDEFGTSFCFSVNGVPIFAKGANWIPADSFPTRIADDHLEHLIRSSAEANMNMLRVWGGGFYEEERFYDLCDQYGILVWQDFAFSCAIYPGDDAFMSSAREEAVQNVRRLRHRASLAVWCGNNEMEWGWVEWGWDSPDRLGLKKAYDEMFHHMLPSVCEAEDGGRPYWPSSPSSGVPFADPNSVRAGDTHNWEVWHRNLPFAGYRDHPSRFVSEFGFQSLPALETIQSYATAADLNMTSYVMEHHQRSGVGNGKMITYLTDHFQMPKDFESLVYLTQVLQAEAMRYGVEYWRRSRDCTGGALYWQLNDCWPVASWASIDYFGRWKALQYAARRFFQPVLLSAEDDGTGVMLHVTNDLPSPWEGRVEWSLEALDGAVMESGSIEIRAPGVGSVEVSSLDFSGSVTDSNRRQAVLVYELWKDDARLSQAIAAFAPSKHMKLSDPGLRAAVSERTDGYRIAVTADRLARFVWLGIPDHDVVFSDNCFDLPAGRTAKVRMPPVDGISAQELAQLLVVRSLWDSF